jgi:hypothetical protein
MGKAVEIPYGYGDVIAITGSGAKVVVWLKDSNSMVRGLLLDVTDPANPMLGKDEIVLRRKTEGQVRRKKLPPVGQALDATAPAAEKPAAVPAIRPMSFPPPAAKPAAAVPASRPAVPPRPPAPRPPV